MKTIAHISDLHFGRLAEETLAPLRAAIAALGPDLVAISGDLTQRARKSQFREAAGFLKTLPQPQIVVPGNHDVPLYNVLGRWLWPLANFRRCIEDSLFPRHADAEIAALGLNSARSLTIKDGRLNPEQMREACGFFSAHKSAVLRILVTHHPFDVPEGMKERDILGRAERAMAEFAACGVDMILTGHMHGAHISGAARRYGPDNGILLVQAGTATSSRLRNETNSWNVIRLDQDVVSVEVMAWRPDSQNFTPDRQSRFRRNGNRWEALAG
jgi:3',5'-cyclic AMP phosphodiesterase CpdA